MVSIVLVIFGLLIGSFINVVIVRLSKGQQFISGRSHCQRCQSVIRWYDNIPIVSFVLLRGNCRSCQGAIGWQYPLVELVMAVQLWWLYQAFGLTWSFVLASILGAMLLLIFVYDARFYLIPDSVSLPAVVVAILFSLSIGRSWETIVIGAVIGAGFFLLQFLISSGRWIGGGDIRLGAVMGCALGWQLTLVGLFFSYIVGAVVAVVMIALGKKEFSSKIPFGTFLTAATMATLVYGHNVLQWYLGRL